MIIYMDNYRQHVNMDPMQFSTIRFVLMLFFKLLFCSDIILCFHMLATVDIYVSVQAVREDGGSWEIAQLVQAVSW